MKVKQQNQRFIVRFCLCSVQLHFIRWGGQWCIPFLSPNPCIKTGCFQDTDVERHEQRPSKKEKKKTFLAINLEGVISPLPNNL